MPASSASRTSTSASRSTTRTRRASSSPAIVVGDRRTGATQKYDGPYYVIRWLLRQPRIAVLPMLGDSARSLVNVVPRDFVVDAMAALGSTPEGRGATYHLADPEPLTVDGIVAVLARATGRRVVRMPVPIGLASAVIDRVLRARPSGPALGGHGVGRSPPHRCAVTATWRQKSSTGQVEHRGRTPVQTCLPNGTSSRLISIQ